MLKSSQLKSSQVIRTLGIPYHQLVAAIRAGKVHAPPKDASGDFLWSPADVEIIRQALRTDRRRRKAVTK